MKSSKRGIWLVLGMFVVGGIALAGLFLSPRASSPPAPVDVPWDVPPRKLKFVSYNTLHCQRGLDRVAADIKKHEPDFVLLQEVEYAHAMELGRTLGMSDHYYPQLYQTSVNLAGPRASWGNLILSRHKTYAAESIPNPGGGSFGVWAVAVIEGRKFMIANVHLSATWNANPLHIKKSGENRASELKNLVDAWRGRGSPPIVIGGDFNQVPVGNNYSVMSETWTDALGTLGQDAFTFGEGLLRTRIDYFLVSKEWSATAGGVAEKGASDHRLIWVDLMRK